MIEVEAKARINNPKEYMKKSSKMGKFIGKQVKIDDYYTLNLGKGYPHKSLRIRKREGFYEVNFKNKISYITGVHAKKETEFRVGDITNLLKVIKEFGYKKWLTKHKESYVYETTPHFHIEINNVRGLGWFAEVEYLCSKKEEVVKSREEVLKVMDKLGIERGEIVKAGYTKLLWEKHPRRLKD